MDSATQQTVVVKSEPELEVDNVTVAPSVGSADPQTAVFMSALEPVLNTVTMEQLFASSSELLTVVLKSEPITENNNESMEETMSRKSKLMTDTCTDFMSFMSSYQTKLTLRENDVAAAEREIEENRKRFDESRIATGLTRAEDEIVKMRVELQMKDALVIKLKSEVGKLKSELAVAAAEKETENKQRRLDGSCVQNPAKEVSKLKAKLVEKDLLVDKLQFQLKTSKERLAVVRSYVAVASEKTERVKKEKEKMQEDEVGKRALNKRKSCNCDQDGPSKSARTASPSNQPSSVVGSDVYFPLTTGYPSVEPVQSFQQAEPVVPAPSSFERNDGEISNSAPEDWTNDLYKVVDRVNLLCTACFKKFKTQNLQDFVDHILSKGHKKFSSVTFYECSCCDERFDSHQAMITHCELHAAIGNDHRAVTTLVPLENQDKPTCTVCRRSFKMPRDLKNHIFAKHTCKQHQCRICRARFDSKAAQLQHYTDKHLPAEPIPQLNISQLGLYPAPKRPFRHSLKLEHQQTRPTLVLEPWPTRSNPDPSLEQEYRPTGPSLGLEHQSTRPSLEQEHQLIRPSLEQEHQPTRPSLEQEHQPIGPSLELEHQPTGPFPE